MTQPKTVPEHREKAVEAAYKVVPGDAATVHLRVLDAAEPHLQRMYWEQFREAVTRLAEDRAWVEDLRAGGVRRERALDRVAPEYREGTETNEWITCPKCEGEGEVGMEWIGEKFVAESGTPCPLCKGAMGLGDQAALDKAQELIEGGEAHA